LPQFRKARLQCEFLYCDAKEHTGLAQTHRSQQKLRYYLNQEVPQEAPSPWLTLKHNIPMSCYLTGLLTCSELPPNSSIIPERFSNFIKWAKLLLIFITDYCKI